MCPAFHAGLQIIFAGDECRRPRRRQSVKIVCLTIDDLMPLFLFCSYGNGSVFSSLPLPCFVHILAEIANVKTFEFYAANCSKPNRSKNAKKTRTLTHFFFEKNTGSNLAMLVRAVTQQTHRPQKRNKNTDFDPLLNSTKRVTCALHSTHHLPTASAAPTPHISPQQTYLPPTYLKVTSTRPSRECS